MNIRITLKWVISIVIIISSIIICIFGLNYQRKQGNQDKIANAESTFADETTRLESIQQQVNEYYLDDTHEFIKADIDLNELETLLNSVTIVKTTPEDFDLKQTDFSETLLKKSEKLTSLKTDIVEKLNDLTVKQESQTKIATLFLQAPTNWQVDEGNNVINESLTMDQIEQIRPLIYKKQGAWREAMDRFLTDAQTQLSQYMTLKKSIEGQMDGEQLAASATLETYLTLVEQAQAIKNEQMRTELLTKLDAIHSLLVEPVAPDPAVVPEVTVDEEPNQVEEVVIE
ncbi:hypothetical protein ACYSNW_16010 [Enterococcus sp. LJL99]